MRVKIAGLDPHQQYYIAMDIVPVDNKRYRSVNITGLLTYCTTVSLRDSWIAQVLSQEISPIHLANLQQKGFSNDLEIRLAISFLIVLMKPGSNCSLCPLKAPEEDIQKYRK